MTQDRKAAIPYLQRQQYIYTLGICHRWEATAIAPTPALILPRTLRSQLTHLGPTRGALVVDTPNSTHPHPWRGTGLSWQLLHTGLPPSAEQLTPACQAQASASSSALAVLQSLHSPLPAPVPKGGSRGSRSCTCLTHQARGSPASA